jgi:hypothetical protein
MRLVILLGVLFALAPLDLLAATIEHPRVKGLPVDHCPLINNAADCHRTMMAATLVCKEYGFRRALDYRLLASKTPSVRVLLSINDGEIVTASGWKSGGAAVPFAAINCSR